MSDRLTIRFENNEETLNLNEVIKFDGGGVELRLNEETGLLQLYDRKGKLLSEVDLPTEKIIKNAYYDYNTGELVLEFENSPTVRIPIKTNLDGYVKEEDLREMIANSEDYDINSNEEIPTTKAVKTIVDNVIENAITKVLNEEV